jgi:flagellar biogenesis protein FliO
MNESSAIFPPSVWANKPFLRSLLEHAQRAWSWIERRRAQQFTARRLRLAETISLGEKRFVSILKVDGVDMLIGCSASNVVLLKVLDAPSASNPDALAKLEQAL